MFVSSAANWFTCPSPQPGPRQAKKGQSCRSGHVEKSPRKAPQQLIRARSNLPRRSRAKALKDRRSALDLPALKIDFLQEILSNLQGVVDAVPNPQKKHLLHLLVKKVLIKDQHTFEAWYRLPQFPGVRILGQMVAPRLQCANHSPTLSNTLWHVVIFRLTADSIPVGILRKGPAMPTYALLGNYLTRPLLHHKKFPRSRA